ncbi:hypothetical protein McpAg1_05850 [Methanocorpusculaceae archaeon Ag1]|uniref:Uncharacterized protein n=1 Tax=Methanorbis furvi TaxID=3028299 RepID=A0AAE4MC12_9EURY|nr:hypothetical protein [Methanocorpusculaceae archaeon Ag1]
MHGERLRRRNARKDFRDNLFSFTPSKYEKYIPCIPAPQAFSVHFCEAVSRPKACDFHFSVKFCVLCAFRGYSKRGQRQKISNNETHHRVSPILKTNRKSDQ